MMRYPELDVGRGIAVLAMIIYHFLFDLYYFRTIQQPAVGFAMVIAASFIFISGICLYISYCRGARFKSFLLRTLKLGAAAAVISVVSYLVLGKGFILFGVLHFFAVSGLCIYPFLKLKRRWLLVAFALIFFALPLIVQNTNSYLLWLVSTPFFTLDYFPLLPWLGVYLLGVCFADIFYRAGKRRFKIQALKLGPLDLIGRNSLLIYFLHQPVILAILYLFGLRF